VLDDYPNCEFINTNNELDYYMEKIYIITGGGVTTSSNICLPNLPTSTPQPSIISLETCMNICADIKIYIFENYITLLKEGQLAEAIKTIYNIHEYGFSVIDICNHKNISLIDHLDEILFKFE
jgi:hypothetical protein